MSERIILRTGEALVEGAEDYLAAEPEVVIGELDGPVGHALASLIGGITHSTAGAPFTRSAGSARTCHPDASAAGGC